MTSATVVLSLTAEHEGHEDWEAFPYGFAVFRVGPHEIGRTELDYNEYEDGRDGLERAAARWLAAVAA